MPGADRLRDLRLPTKIVAVRLALLGRPPFAAEVFVADAPRRPGGHLLDDLAAQLAAAAAFIAVRWAERVRLLGTHAISWIAVRRPGADDAPLSDAAGDDLAFYDRQHRVEVELLEGGPLIGTLLDSAPADRPRVIDHLNHAGLFLRLWTPAEHYLINTRQIVAVSELSEVAGAALPAEVS